MTLAARWADDEEAEILVSATDEDCAGFMALSVDKPTQDFAESAVVRGKTTQDFAESAVVRGKTKPGTNAGSFAKTAGRATPAPFKSSVSKGKPSVPSNPAYAAHMSKLDASKAKVDALKQKVLAALEKGGAPPALREKLREASAEHTALGKVPPFSAKQSAKNVAALEAASTAISERVEAGDEAAEYEPGAEVQYTSEAAMLKIMAGDKVRGFDWDKGAHRFVVRAPEDRGEWPLHCLGFMSDGSRTRAIPPDAKDVYLCLNEDSAFWGSYMPSNGGSRQPVYHPDYNGQSKSIGDERVRGMAEDLPGISSAVAKAVKTSKGVDAEHAFVQMLNLHTLIRTGNEDQKTANKVQRDKNAENYGEILEKGKKTYGLTTLQANHVKERKDGLHLEFDGKMGEDVDVLVTDPALIKGLRARAKKQKDAGKPSGKLFGITDTSLRTWRESVSIGNGRTLDHYKIHDIRSRVASDEALKLVNSMPAPKNEVEWKSAFQKVIAHVGPLLGHKPKGMITATAYILPDVWAKWSKHADQKIMAKINKAHGVTE